MSGNALVDTSVIIDFLRSKDKTESHFYKAQEKYESLYVSMITRSELYSGRSVWESKKAKKDLLITFESVSILNFTEDIADLAGKIRSTYGVDLIDAIIAATAIQNQIPLMTINTKHFKMIKGLELVKI